MDQVTISRELLRQAYAEIRHLSRMANVDHTERSIIGALRAALEQPAVAPFGHVTVRRLSQRFENHVDLYQFYPAGQIPYTDNVDECIAVYTAPQAQQPAAQQPQLLTDDEIWNDDELISGNAIAGLMLTDYATVVRIIETAVLKKNGLS